MKYKTVIKVFVIAFLLFLVTVALGLKFNWVKYLKDDSNIQGQALAESTDVLGETGNETSTTKRKANAVQVEIISDQQVSSSTTAQIKNDCIRASRRAGVGDSEIHAVVRECVALSLQARNTPAEAFTNDIGTNNGNRVNTYVEDENLSLTRDACTSFVAEQQGLSAEEKEKRIAQCIKENTQ